MKNRWVIWLGLGLMAVLFASCTIGGEAPEVYRYFVYVTNARRENVSVYSMDKDAADLNAAAGSPFTTGAEPRAVAVDPAGKFAYVANFADDNISAFTIEKTTGELTPVPGSPFDAGTSPCS